jgi:pyruvate kinase
MSSTLQQVPEVELSFAGPLAGERKTKIVCTLGPASWTEEHIRGLIVAGANVFRLNFSHSDHAWHSRALGVIRETAANLNQGVAVMQDLCGPKIRVSRLRCPDYDVKLGDTVCVTTEQHAAGPNPPEFDIASTYMALVDDVSIGDRILLDDGRIELEALSKQPNLLVTRVTRPGRITLGKGINLPGINLSTRSMTHKDWEDLEWGITHDVDFVALSFVRHPDDLVAVRDRLDEAGSRTRLIAKIERPEAIEHIEAILALADGLMVARGDLGLETELSRVPILQKRLIERCRQANKPVITATQMLESMVNASTPTRAEISDVANAIYDGTDAIMLSAETATGQYPEEAVNVLHKVAVVTEADLAESSPYYRRLSTTSAATAIAEGAAITARSLGARRVVVYSQTGVTARLMAHYRLPMPVVAVTNVLTTYRQLSLSFGIHPVYMPDIVSMSQLLEEMDQLVLARHWGEVGDTLVLVSSLDGRDGNTDTLHVHHVRS